MQQETMTGQRVAPGHAAAKQRVVGDLEHEHTHDSVVHGHDHYHVSHHHRSHEIGEAFEHRSTYHSHEHNHSEMVHGHKDREPDTERREHDEMAHTHDHARPSRSQP
jgi:hypothetical protein